MDHFDELGSEVENTFKLLVNVIIIGDKQDSSETKAKFFMDLCKMLTFLLEGAALVAKRENLVTTDAADESDLAEIGSGCTIITDRVGHA